METEHIFISRPDVREQVEAAVGRSAEGSLQLVWLFGETGQGKTHFLRHYLDEIHERQLVSYAQCSSPLGNQSTTVLKPHQPLKDIFENLLINQASTRRKTNLIKNVSLTVLAMIPIVGDVAYGVKEIRRDLKEYKSGKRDVDFTNFIREYFSDLVKFAAETPIVIVIDDIQWSDTPTIEALMHFLSDEKNVAAPITIILSGRLDEIQGVPELLAFNRQLAQKENVTELTLPPFTSAQIREFYSLRFPGCFFDPELMLWLQQKTGGNPFFLQSYITHLQVEGILQKNGILAGDLETYRGLPAEIKLVTSWLMKSLSETDLNLLLTASVLGYEFSLHELAHLTQRASLELIRSLRHIRTMYGICEAVGFRLVNGKESTVYRFTQHAVHTALYNELTTEEKEALHRMTAHYLNDIRLSKRDDPEAQNSIASALMLHSHLGRQPDLEYQSILMKAQFTPDDLDDESVLEKLRQLSPDLGVPWETIERSYQQALQLAPVNTRHLPQETITLSVPDEERDTDALSDFVTRILGLLSRGSVSEANVLLEMYLNKTERKGQAAHPIVDILYALTCQMLGKDIERSMKSFRAATSSPLHPTYSAIAHLGIAMFQTDENETEILMTLKAAVQYQGRYRGIVQTTVAYLIGTRFGGKKEFAALLEQKTLGETVSESATHHFPKTVRRLRR